MEDNTPTGGAPADPRMEPIIVKQATTVAEVTAALRDVFQTTVQFVVAVEQAIPEGGKGKEKLQQVVQGAMAYAPLVGLSLAFVDRLAPLLEAFASRVVARFNAFSWPK